MKCPDLILTKIFNRALGAIVFFGIAVNAIADSKPDQETEFDVAAHSSSVVYNRPGDAEYFWWDIEPPIDAELVFEDGTRSTVGSDKEFYKKIITVKFINPRDSSVHVKLHARF